MSRLSRHCSTHKVFNQSIPFINCNLVGSDPAILNAISNFVPKSILEDVGEKLEQFGMSCGSDVMSKTAENAEQYPPRLRQFDEYGRRVDLIDYTAAYHTLMDHGISKGVVSHGFQNEQKKVGSHCTRGIMLYLENQLEPGHCCPIVMTTASIPVLEKVPFLKKQLIQLQSNMYDGRNVPMDHKGGITIGMSMTEKQGGSDVRANTTTANPAQATHTGEGAVYHLTGHKWFTSAAMSDAFLTLAKVEGSDAISCFLVPRWIPELNNSKNTEGISEPVRNSGFKIMRIKNKLGDKANASSEVEYDKAWSVMIGEPGKGVKTIMEMVQCTRLDCALGSAAGFRRAIQIALNHTVNRKAFGKRLIEQPLMMNLLADLCIESEAHSLTAFRMASIFDEYRSDCLQPSKGTSPLSDLFRIGVAVSKYYITKRLPNFTYECMEVLGGNGFVEDFPIARLFRQSPLNSIWEGSGNVMALDMLRAHHALHALLDDIDHNSRGMSSDLDIAVKYLRKVVDEVSKDPHSLTNQQRARSVMDRFAMVFEASNLLRFCDNDKIANAYLQSRICSQFQSMDQSFTGFGMNYGSSVSFDYKLCEEIIQRNLPILSTDGFLY